MAYTPKYTTKAWARKPLGNDKFARGLHSMVTTFVNTKNPKK